MLLNPLSTCTTTVHAQHPQIKSTKANIANRPNQLTSKAMKGAMMNSCMSTERYHVWGNCLESSSSLFKFILNPDLCRSVTYTNSIWVYIILNVEQRRPPICFTLILYRVCKHWPKWTTTQKA